MAWLGVFGQGGRIEVAQMGYLCEEIPIYGVSRDALVDHVA